MIYSATQIIAVFTGSAKPLQIVNYQLPGNDAPSASDNIMKQFQGTTLPTGGMFDQKSLNTIINMSIYYFIMQFLMGLGYKFATLGVSMLRPIVVQVKNKKLEQVVEEEEKG